MHAGNQSLQCWVHGRGRGFKLKRQMMRLHTDLVCLLLRRLNLSELHVSNSAI
jgi:hypothetical protein